MQDRSVGLRLSAASGARRGRLFSQDRPATQRRNGTRSGTEVGSLQQRARGRHSHDSASSACVRRFSSIMSPGSSESKPTPAASGDADREIESIKRRLREALPRLRETYAVEQLYLHGSRLRGEAGPDSDLDVLVDFQDSEAGREATLLDFIALKQELEDLLGVDVDLGERTALRGPAGDAIRQEAEPV